MNLYAYLKVYLSPSELVNSYEHLFMLSRNFRTCHKGRKAIHCLLLLNPVLCLVASEYQRINYSFVLAKVFVKNVRVEKRMRIMRNEQMLFCSTVQHLLD